MVHRTIKLEEGLTGSQTRLAQAVVEHHRHVTAVYGFVRDALTSPQSASRQLEAMVHVRLLEACADWLELLEPGLKPQVRTVLNRYLDEVAKVACVVRMRAAAMETDEGRLKAALEDILRVLEASEEAQVAVEKRHSDTTV